MAPSSTQGTRWARPLHTPGGGEAFLLYYVFGQLPRELAPPRETYRIGAMPAELRVSRHAATDPRAREVLAQPLFAHQLAEAPPALGAAVRAAPTCLLIHGQFPDPASLDYLRDTVGLLAYLFDQGAVAVLDAFRVTWWDRDSFREKLFLPDSPEPLEQVLLLGTEDHGGSAWLHTRGMRKFGRPDLSIHGVTEAEHEGATAAIGKLVQLLAKGALVPDGQVIQVPGVPGGLVCRLQGAVDDPEFHNVHMELSRG
jgi:hypothetical protein